MAFRKSSPVQTVPDSPEEILLQLPRRKISAVYLHQGQLMQSYALIGAAESDVALQLPTGSGKTLVGLLIGEWRRRKNNEKVVYLCPTQQLVNQVISQAETYGLNVNGFIGSHREYSPSAIAEYQSGNKIAVTTYNSLFNTHPFFDSPDVIIFDDAHASENYIASMWSLRVVRSEANLTLFSAISSILRPHLPAIEFARLNGSQNPNVMDSQWVDKIPTPTMIKINNELTAVIDQHAGVLKDVIFAWHAIKGHLDACHMYISPNEILIRPMIPPTWTHEPFANAKHRIFMSATLGEGGDLERLTGRQKIKRIPIPAGWDRQGIGRRFFIFPEMAVEKDQIAAFRHALMKKVPRSVYLVPSNLAEKNVTNELKSVVEQVFDADAIGKSKDKFRNSESATAVIANRYDGIDFPGDQCRLLFIDGLPRTTNAQERFIYSRMSAGILLRGRIQTRVVQAVGRCTRSLEDYSAVVITGADMTSYLSDPKRRVYFHPELQAELDFGAEQSMGSKPQDILDNFDIFLRNDQEWEDANDGILEKRANAVQIPHPGIKELGEIVKDEIEYQKCLWNGNYEKALDLAGAVLAKLNLPELKGYRALWNYLAGSAAALAVNAGITTLEGRITLNYKKALEASTNIRWLAVIARSNTSVPIDQDKLALQGQIVRLETQLLEMGTQHEAKFAYREKSIQEGLASNESNLFENALVMLGTLLGFDAGNEETDAAPDPWWIADDYCLVFEAHSDGKPESSLGANKARQASSHPKWIKQNAQRINLSDSSQILPVLITPVTTVNSGAVPHLEGLSLWRREEFREWVNLVISVIRQLRQTLGDEPDLSWQAHAQKVFEQHGFDAPTLFKRLSGQKAAQMLDPSSRDDDS